MKVKGEKRSRVVLIGSLTSDFNSINNKNEKETGGWCLGESNEHDEIKSLANAANTALKVDQRLTKVD